MAGPIAAKATDEILRHYDIVPPREGKTEEAVEVALGGYKKASGQKLITVTVGNVSQSRPCPISDGEAHDMVRRLSAKHLFPNDAALGTTLERLVANAAKMYAVEPIDSFVLQPVFVLDDHYRIGSARMFGATREPSSKTV